MILSGREIHKHLGKEIVIEPFDEKRLNPNSYNLSLADELLVYENRELDMKLPNPVKKSGSRRRAFCWSQIASIWGAQTSIRIQRDSFPCWKAVPLWEDWGCLFM